MFMLSDVVVIVDRRCRFASIVSVVRCHGHFYFVPRQGAGVGPEVGAEDDMKNEEYSEA